MRCVRTCGVKQKNIRYHRKQHIICHISTRVRPQANSLALMRLKISCETVAVPPPTDSSGSSAAAASAIRSLVMLLLLATCLLVSVGALRVEANDDTAGATRSVGWGDAGLNADDGVAARTKARAAAEIPADLMVSWLWRIARGNGRAKGRMTTRRHACYATYVLVRRARGGGGPDQTAQRGEAKH